MATRARLLLYIIPAHENRSGSVGRKTRLISLDKVCTYGCSFFFNQKKKKKNLNLGQIFHTGPFKADFPAHCSPTPGPMFVSHIDLWPRTSSWNIISLCCLCIIITGPSHQIVAFYLTSLVPAPFAAGTAKGQWNWWHSMQQFQQLHWDWRLLLYLSDFVTTASAHIVHQHLVDHSKPKLVVRRSFSFLSITQTSCNGQFRPATLHRKTAEASRYSYKCRHTLQTSSARHRLLPPASSPVLPAAALRCTLPRISAEHQRQRFKHCISPPCTCTGHAPIPTKSRVTPTGSHSSLHSRVSRGDSNIRACTFVAWGLMYLHCSWWLAGPRFLSLTHLDSSADKHASLAFFSSVYSLVAHS